MEGISDAIIMLRLLLCLQKYSSVVVILSNCCFIILFGLAGLSLIN